MIPSNENASVIRFIRPEEDHCFWRGKVRRTEGIMKKLPLSAIDSVRLFGGRHIPEIREITGLIKTQNTETIRLLLGTLDEKERRLDENRYLIEYYVNGSMLQAAQYTEKLAALAERNINHEFELIYFTFFVEKNEVIFQSRLERLQQYKRHPGAWMRLAKMFVDLYQDKTKAKICLNEATQLRNELVYFSTLKRLWFELLGDEKKTRWLFAVEEKNIEKYSRDDTWCLLAEDWHTILHEEKEAERCIAVAEQQKQYWGIAETIKLIYNDDIRSRALLQRAVHEAKNCSEHLDAARAFKTVINDIEAASNCLRIAEEEANNEVDWHNCASMYAELFEPEEYATRETYRCLMNGEKYIEATPMWLWHAEHWMSICGDTQEAFRCIQNARRSAHTIDEIIDCGKKFAALGFKDEARECLSHLPSTPNDVGGLLQRAAIYIDYEMEESSWRSFVFDAEEKANSCRELSKCAQFWAKAVHASGEALRCMEKAERIASSYYEWTFLGDCYNEELNNAPKAQFCYDEGRKILQSIGYFLIK